MPEIVYVNGRITRPEEATVSALDRGFLYGDGLFETMRAYGGTVFRLERHLDRLYASTEVLRIRLPHARDELAGIIRDLLARSGIAEACVRLAVSRGVGINGLRLDGGTPTVVIWVRELTPYPASLYDCGARLLVSRYRVNSASPLPPHKTANYLLCLLARDEARAAGADEALLLNERGEIAEGATTNVFLVKDGAAATPPPGCGLLPGITREAVLGLCAEGGVPCGERVLSLDDLPAADEVFLTNSVMEVMPVSRVNSRRVGAACPGPVTLYLGRRYRDLVRRETA